MLYNYIILAFCVSIDSLGTGITYGLKNTKISISAKIILFAFSFIITSLSMFLGNKISHIFSEFYCRLIGSLILCFIGLWIICGEFKKDKVDKNYFFQGATIHEIFLDFLGITIKIIKNPKYSDLDNSNNIDAKEALFLAIALSLDSIGVSIGGSILGISSIWFSFWVSLFQFVFLTVGTFLGKKIKSITIIPDNWWSIISGVVLIIVSVVKLFV